MGVATMDARALSLEKLLMPGELTDAHAEFEEACGQCHEGSKEADQTRQCLDCHDHQDVAKDIVDKTGFHGRSPAVRNRPCKQCHSEHLGRSADIVLLDVSAFDHTVTDFELRGAHQGVNCAACHKPEEKYSAAPSRCVDCHLDDDHHRGKLGEECSNCHEERQWREAKFDHDKTEFPLLGKHNEVSCELCHAGQRYEKTPKDCNACHRVQDVHRGRNGDSCEKCHAPEGWKNISFDHSKTDFPLQGKHRDASCRSCHRGILYQEELETECVVCHRSDDAHKGRNGEKCKDCHSPKGWSKTQFDHDKDTKFALRGSHRELRCESCHVENAYRKKLKAECYACHRDDDVHEGQEGELCGSCHREAAWGNDVVFEHDITAFPLIGIHATTPCEQCHLSATYKDTTAQCADCHADDDPHEDRLGSDCETCHNPNDWLLWLFDHDQQTEFAIDGAHADLTCRSCHRIPTGGRKPTLRTSCSSCHKVDDVHSGGFGTNCERCHNTETFGGAFSK